MKLQSVIFSLCCIFSVMVQAQPITFEKYYDYGFADVGNCVRQTSDGGYIVIGRQGITFGLSRVILMKTNDSGQVQWTKFIGNPNDNYGHSGQQTSDGGYIITGYTTLPGLGANVYIIKTDSNGDTLWTKNYGGATYDIGNEIQQTFDGGYIVAGQTDMYGWLLKMNINGDTTWTKKIIPISSNGVELTSVQQTSDGGFIVTGVADFTGTNNDIFLAKTNSDGDTLWTRRWGGTNIDWGKSVQQTLDGGFIVAGYAWGLGNGHYDVYLIKTDSNGNAQWTKAIGDSTENSSASIQQTSDGGYIITGMTRTNFPSPNWYDLYLIKTNSNGDTLWTKTFGSGDSDWGNFVRQTQDGGYIITGMTRASGDIYFIKTDSNGSPMGINFFYPNEKPSMLVYPNPASTLAHVRLHSYSYRKNYDLVLSDITGREIEKIRLNCNEGEINVANVPDGLYYIYILFENKIISTHKIIIQH